MPVGELLARMSSRELAEWQAYDRVEPLEWKADYRMAVLAAVFANTFRGKGQSAFKPEDFVPQYEGREADSMEDMRLKAAQIFGFHGGGEGEEH